MFSQYAPDWERVEGIRQWIHDNIEYAIGSTNTTSTACDVFLQRAWVCRDFAHRGIASCRALNIPARFVVGYIKFPEGAPGFHAVFEAWLGNRCTRPRSTARTVHITARVPLTRGCRCVRPALDG